MCEIKSFEELLEKYDADSLENHIKECSSCRKQFSREYFALYPDIPSERLRFKKSFKRASFKLTFPVFAGALTLMVFIVFMFNNTTSEGRNGFDDINLSYSDCLEIIESVNDNDFIEIINSIQEEL